jgi:hypothetical protein
MIIAGVEIDQELSNYNLNKDNEVDNNILELLEAIIFANKKLIEAVEEDKNIEDVKDALANFAQINFKNNDGKTALELALSKENSKKNDEIIKYLEDNGGNASNTKDLIISFEKRIENITKRAEEENNKTQGNIVSIEKSRSYAYDLLKKIKLLDEDIGGNISDKLIEFYNDLKKLRSPFDFVKQIRDEEKLFRNSLIDNIKQNKIYKIKDESKIDELLDNIKYIIKKITTLNYCEGLVTKFIDIILYKASVNPDIKNNMLWKSINARKDEYKRQINIIREEDKLLIEDDNIIPFWTSKINNLKKHSNYEKIEEDLTLNTILYFIRGDELVYNDIFMDEIEKFKLPPQIYVSDFIPAVKYNIINIIKKILDTNKVDIKDKLDIALRTVIAYTYKNTNDIIKLLVNEGANPFIQYYNDENLEDLSIIDKDRKDLIMDLKYKVQKSIRKEPVGVE